LGAPQALAQDLFSEVKIGALYHDVPGLWSGFQREATSVDVNMEVLFAPSLPFLGGTLRPAAGGTVNTDGQTSHAYVDARWQYDLTPRLFFDLGLGAAVHDGNLDDRDPARKALGSRVLFHIPLELGYRLDDHDSLSVYFEHTSNAYTQEFNEGLDRLGLRYGYRF
jgi:hypothetical protein